MIGFYSRQFAIEDGFTHEGSVYGIPIWMTVSEGGEYMVATKCVPLDYLLTVFETVDMVLHSILFPNDQFEFRFLVKGQINGENTNG